MAGKADLFGKPGVGPGAGEGNSEEAGKEEGLPLGLLQGSGPLGVTFKAPTAESDSIPTRVKMPTPAQEAKAAKEDAKLKTDAKPGPNKLDIARGTVSERRVAEVGDKLQEKMDQLAAVLSFKLPVTGVYTGENSPRAVAALLNIAKKRPKFLDALEKASDGIDALEIGQFALGVLTAVQVDTGRLAPDAMPAQITGVTKVIEQYFTGDETDSVNPNVMSMPEPKHAKRFEPAS